MATWRFWADMARLAWLLKLIAASMFPRGASFCSSFHWAIVSHHSVSDLSSRAMLSMTAATAVPAAEVPC